MGCNFKRLIDSTDSFDSIRVKELIDLSIVIFLRYILPFTKFLLIPYISALPLPSANLYLCRCRAPIASLDCMEEFSGTGGHLDFGIEFLTII